MYTEPSDINFNEENHDNSNRSLNIRFSTVLPTPAKNTADINNLQQNVVHQHGVHSPSSNIENRAPRSIKKERKAMSSSTFNDAHGQNHHNNDNNDVKKNTKKHIQTAPCSSRYVKFKGTEEKNSDSYMFKQPVITENVLNLREKALTRKLPKNLPNQTYDELIFALSLDRKEMITRLRFKESTMISNTIDYVKELQFQIRKKNLQKETERIATRGLLAVTQDLKDFDKETERLKEELESQIRHEREQLLKKQRHDFVENEKMWKSEERIKQYTHGSVTLTNIKKQFNMLVMASRYKEAERLQEEYKRQKYNEESRSFISMQQDYDESLRKIRNTHKKQLDDFEMQADTRRKNLEGRRRKDRIIYELKVAKNEFLVEGTKDEEKVWNKNITHRRHEYAVGSFSLQVPTLKITRKDLWNEDFDILSLPPLDFRKKNC